MLDPKYSHGALLFHGYVSNIWDNFSSGIVTPSKNTWGKTIFDGISSKMFEQVSKLMVSSPDGGTPQGFKYGYNEKSAIGFKDLLYVNPDADPNNESTWVYDHDEEEKVLDTAEELEETHQPF